MNKRTSRHIGKPFATLGAKFAACALSASLYSLGMLGGSVALTETAYAATCTSGEQAFLCATWNGGWQRGDKGSGVLEETIRIGGFTFPNPNPGYPVDSNNYVSTTTEPIHVSNRISTGSPPSNIPVRIYPETQNLIWRTTTVNGKSVSGYTVKNLSENLLLNFEFQTEGAWTPVSGNNGATVYVSAPAKSSSKDIAVRVRVRATVVGDIPKITVPLVDIFYVDFDTMSRLGKFKFAGNPTPVIDPPPPPAPKTCDSVNGTTRTLDLGKIAVTDLNNNTRQNSKNDTFDLLNCPAGVRLRLTLEDVNSTASTQNYLTNSLTGDAAAANAGIQLIFEGDANPKRMKTSWTRTGANTANATNPIKYSARFFHIGGNLKPGKIESAAKLTIEYP